MSDELAQDDEGFEIADFGVEGDDDEEEEDHETRPREGDRTQPSQDEPRYDPAPSGNKSKTIREVPRESLDGDTVFAVGEDGDRWSEDGSEEERGTLVAKPDKE